MEDDNILTDGLVENGQIIKLPLELRDAPEDIKKYYTQWIEIDTVIESNPRRYFNFINEKTGDAEQIDAAGLNTRVQKIAKKRGISDVDLKRLDDACREMAELKHQKTRIKFKWLKYVRARYGKGVFDWRKADILEWYSHYDTHEEVKKKLEEAGYSVETTQLMNFFLNNKDVIDKKRVDFVRSSHDHYLATDAGRMETLALLHAKFMKLFNESYGKIEPNKLELKALSQEIRAIVEQARKEIKGEEVRLTVDGKIDINASLQAAATIQDISRKLPINIIPIYLVAAKQGINPNNILSSLIGSFYKDFNGFNRLKTKGEVPTTMDIIRNYDWNEIAQFHENKKNEVEETIDYEEISFVEAEKVKSKREKLLEMINKQISEKTDERDYHS